MTSLKQIINEEISAVKRDDKEELFDYNSAKKETWNEPFSKAKEFQRISFDLENDDSNSKKTFFIKKNLRKDQPIKYEIQAEMRIAGGDWEMPVIYFRVEFTHDYNVFNVKWESKPEFVFDTKDYHGHKFVIL